MNNTDENSSQPTHQYPEGARKKEPKFSNSKGKHSKHHRHHSDKKEQKKHREKQRSMKSYMQENAGVGGYGRPGEEEGLMWTEEACKNLNIRKQEKEKKHRKKEEERRRQEEKEKYEHETREEEKDYHKKNTLGLIKKLEKKEEECRQEFEAWWEKEPDRYGHETPLDVCLKHITLFGIWGEWDETKEEKSSLLASLGGPDSRKHEEEAKEHHRRAQKNRNVVKNQQEKAEKIAKEEAEKWEKEEQNCEQKVKQLLEKEAEESEDSDHEKRKKKKKKHHKKLYKATIDWRNAAGEKHKALAVVNQDDKAHHKKCEANYKQSLGGLLELVKKLEEEEEEEEGASNSSHISGHSGPAQLALLLVGSSDEEAKEPEEPDTQGASGVTSYHQHQPHDSEESDQDSKSGGGHSSGMRSSLGKMHKPSPKKDGAQFIPGYNREGHMSSLMGMQYVLSDAAEHVMHNLKHLALKVHESPQSSNDTFSPVKFVGPRNLRVAKASDEKQQTLNVIMPLRMFATTNSYEADLEHKTFSGRVGAVATIIPRVNFGVAYNHHKEKGRNYDGSQLGTASGSVRANTETDSLSATIALNPEEAGPTGHLASCYGWGKINNSRSFTHSEKEARAKGKPSINLTGGLVQAGYNVIISKQLSFTPYIECLISMVRWDPYKELSGPLPCEISENKETLVEKSVGFRNHWQTSNSSQLQTWVAGVSGRRKADSLRCTPLVSPIKKYEAFIPHNKKHYTRTEVGLAYTSNITDKLELGLNTMMRFENAKKIDKKNASFNVTYLY